MSAPRPKTPALRPRFVPPVESPDSPRCPRCGEPIHGIKYAFPPVERPDPEHPGKTVGVFDEAQPADVRRGDWRCFLCLVAARRDHLARQAAAARLAAAARPAVPRAPAPLDPASPVARMLEHAIRQGARKRIIPISGESAGTKRDPTLDKVLGGEARRERREEEARPLRDPTRSRSADPWGDDAPRPSEEW